MNINLTLIIQVCNFLVVYCLLRFFLFKPTIQVIEEERAQKSAILDSIDQQKKSLEVQKKERRRHWYTCQEYFLLHQPPLRKATVTSFAEHDNLFQKTILADGDIAKIAQEVHDFLKEKIKHVH